MSFALDDGIAAFKRLDVWNCRREIAVAHKEHEVLATGLSGGRALLVEHRGHIYRTRQDQLHQQRPRSAGLLASEQYQQESWTAEQAIQRMIS